MTARIKTSRTRANLIRDIKALRSFTRLLGKLHLPSCFFRYEETAYNFNDAHNVTGAYQVSKESYGFGLKESKDFVEKWFEYEEASPSAVPDVAPCMPYPRT
jgi:hypothetical protein